MSPDKVYQLEGIKFNHRERPEGNEYVVSGFTREADMIIVSWIDKQTEKLNSTTYLPEVLCNNLDSGVWIEVTPKFIVIDEFLKWQSKK